MTKEELEKIYDNIQFQMFVEQKIENRNEYSNSLQEKMNLYNYVIDLKQALNEIKKICYGSDMSKQEYDRVSQIIDKVGGNE